MALFANYVSGPLTAFGNLSQALIRTSGVGGML
jgi:hypothetical protein